MDNIQKLIASTEINHGGVKATETKLEVMARVIEALTEKMIIYSKQTRNYKGNIIQILPLMRKKHFNKQTK